MDISCDGWFIWSLTIVFMTTYAIHVVVSFAPVVFTVNGNDRIMCDGTQVLGTYASRYGVQIHAYALDYSIGRHG